MKKPDLMQETMSTRKPRQKKLGLEGEKKEKRYDQISISFEEIIHWGCSSMSSVYMTWQVQKPLVVFWVGITLSKRA